MKLGYINSEIRIILMIHTVDKTRLCKAQSQLHTSSRNGP